MRTSLVQGPKLGGTGDVPRTADLPRPLAAGRAGGPARGLRAKVTEMSATQACGPGPPRARGPPAGRRPSDSAHCRSAAGPGLLLKAPRRLGCRSVHRAARVGMEASLWQAAVMPSGYGPPSLHSVVRSAGCLPLRTRAEASTFLLSRTGQVRSGQVEGRALIQSSTFHLPRWRAALVRSCNLLRAPRWVAGTIVWDLNRMI
jgi:hypothetical protein